MFAMRLHSPRTPLQWEELPDPTPGPGQIRVKVLACGVCRTDLHVVDGDLTHPKLPVTPGHEIIGRVDLLGSGVTSLTVGQRVGIPWLGHTCGHCSYCATDHENLCDHPIFTGYTRDGGYATMAVADAHFAFPMGEEGSDVSLAPLLCAGLIGWRSLGKTGNAQKVGLYGFGAAAHIIAQVLVWQKREVYAFTRPNDTKTQEFARSLGVKWAGGSDALPPEQLDAAIIFAPDGALVPAALKTLRKGGRVVCAGIHMSEIPAFSYDTLWEERDIVSVANLTREDGLEFLSLAPKIGIHTTTTTYALKDANKALDDLRHGRFDGAAVLVP
ncbi:zinc-binding alcohol dehydrogenase family protein [Acetobacter fabarum]|jgi:propanol-preferring alcohol dehydrogenase|uniref:alcohol dehydrogenase n=1 Tax=Acetobacter lovaniensis TaxID=104100 RepID=A0A841QBW2_9PROT|nr:MULTISPECIES: zinc-dependent alcohol dehydrogenase family protein [Acetobacter]MBB6455876.1 propanol-preferring alcohol dehydrogenase [Acetobacter lovaniensis]MCI1242677.1 zinc-dependent alcohol dehydrogenase family protein [Acetobacter fabarum]MCI1697193.1 zinc-dependent alcohol dehydrogenase family protein [Acetobacter lovaniensis]MCI1796183.1 zinc-dependent alcohol dehydrogenase family protein [Acetobacter lovaniensis]MCI1908512.1 zinc-dependent alcohol dehydrogenase family protein [Acet